jgi:hypothetical protein
MTHMGMTETTAQARISRPVMAAIFAGACNLLILILLNYQIHLEQPDSTPLLMILLLLIAWSYYLTPLFAVIFFRHVAAITFTWASTLSIILAGRAYYLVRYYLVGISGLGRPFDVPDMILFLLSAASTILIAIWITVFLACLALCIFNPGEKAKARLTAWWHLMRPRLALAISLVWPALIWLSPSPVGAATLLPLDKPLRFGTDKIVELSAELARHRAYHVDVTFPFRDAKQRIEMSRIVGEPTRSCMLSNECGVPTAFLITIRKNDNIILREERRVFGRYAFDANKYYRRIIGIPLMPGSYTITVEPTGNADELANIDALIELSTDARASDLSDYPVEATAPRTSSVDNCSASNSDFEPDLKRLSETIERASDIPSEFLQRHFAGCTIENARKLLVKNGFAAEELGPEFDDREPDKVISRTMMTEKTIRPIGLYGSLNCRIILQTDRSNRVSGRGFFYFDGP